MDKDFAAISPKLIQAGNVVRFSSGSPWRLVRATGDGQIAIGRARKGQGAYSPPTVGPAEVEPSVILSFGDDQVNHPHSEPLEVRVETVHASQIGRPDVIEVPGADAWATVHLILDGETGSSPRSATRFFTCVNEFGSELQFDSYFEAQQDEPARHLNEWIRRVVRQ